MSGTIQGMQTTSVVKIGKNHGPHGDYTEDIY